MKVPTLLLIYELRKRDVTHEPTDEFNAIDSFQAWETSENYYHKPLIGFRVSGGFFAYSMC